MAKTSTSMGRVGEGGPGDAGRKALEAGTTLEQPAVVSKYYFIFKCVKLYICWPT